jgi:benzylsuccinate CoA-transferase BbsE subunit
MMNYKVLDLSDEKCALAGKILAELGADVIKIEPPAGDPARKLGPFYNNTPGLENSLVWWAFNTSKKSITLDIEKEEGQVIFKKLAKKADVIIESFKPGYLKSLGIGYDDLKKENKGLVMVSVTPFGQYGPYVKYKGDDLVLWALGGVMYQCGYPDRAPMRLNTPQTFLHASLQACAGALAALYGRNTTGEGDYIDCSGMEAVGHLMMYEPLAWAYEHHISTRLGPKSWRGTKKLTQVWQCKDGMVAMRLIGGRQSRTLKPLIDWMIELGEGDEKDLAKYDWTNLDLYNMTEDEINHIEEVWAAFFKKHTKKELFAEALKRRFDLTPVQNCKDLLEDDQLESRGFWVPVKHEDLGKEFKYPGAPFKTTADIWSIKSRAPHLGEHNELVYGELGYTADELVNLRTGGII